MLREISFKCRIKIKTSCLVSYIRYLLYTSTILLRMGLSNSLPLLTSNLLHISLTHICSLPFCLTTFWFSFTQALRTRARKQRAARKHNISDLTAGGSIIENIAQTRRLAETTMDGSSKSSKIIPEEEPTRSGSNDEDEENAGWVSLCFFLFCFHLSLSLEYTYWTQLESDLDQRRYTACWYLCIVVYNFPTQWNCWLSQQIEWTSSTLLWE